MRRLFLGVALVAVWLLLWGEPTWGQLVAGIVVAALLLVLLPTRSSDLDPRLVVRPVPLVRLVGWFLWQFVLSNAYVVRAVVLPGRYVNTGVVHVRLRATSPALAALVANITALTPGMQPVDGRPDGSGLDVHILSLGTEEGVNRVVRRLEDLVLAAFDREAGSDAARAGSDAAGPTGPGVAAEAAAETEADPEEGPEVETEADPEDDREGGP